MWIVYINCVSSYIYIRLPRLTAVTTVVPARIAKEALMIFYWKLSSKDVFKLSV